MVRNDISDKTTKSRSQPGNRSDEPEEAFRIRWALHELGPGRDVPWLANKAGVPISTVYDALRRGIGKPSVAVKLSDALGVSIDWLLTGRSIDAAGNDTSRTPPVGRIRLEEEDLLQDLGLAMIPEVDITYSMGGGSVAGDYIESRMVPFRREWLDRLTRGFKAEVFLTSGEGDSMTPTILDGDDVLVNRADNVIRHQDRIWALGYGELGMIKRVRRLPSGQFQLNSDNPAISPIEAAEDEVHFVGRVIWIGRKV